MTDYTLRVTIFLSCVIALILWQTFYPKKKLQHWKLRWVENISLLAINTITLRFFQPILLSLIALTATKYGLLNLVPFPLWVEIIIGIILLDLAIYWQHNISHKITWIWRLHRVHHSDAELDVTSAVRFHPIEILLSLIYKSMVVVIFGVPAFAILLFDIILNASAMFNHTNIKLPAGLESILRKCIVTPEMHRIHHSRVTEETNSNYGFFLSIWDKLFNTYTSNASLGDEKIQIGMPQTKTYRPKSLLSLLLMPSFKRSDFQNKHDKE
ncbi:sterol desaturase family protein [Marinomonas sp. 15G1-11]|uniref:Sterol desaturase family protein n=1 Tax=Marinomonas phaeophyticola TaxID=3004091 RepID=A0ABT4JNW6_9GAMM|nr:sterol desaturase family protein [Marinomonas sp. 15G1-11]MCZ2720069.1 sterol desaturase family protein [Marinomonas sp. 15G1-11]